MRNPVVIAYVVLQDSIEFDVDGVGDHLAAVSDVLDDYVSGGRHGVRGQESDDGGALSGVGDLHGTGHYHVAPAQYLVADVLHALRRVHQDLHVVVHLLEGGENFDYSSYFIWRH